jgi:hypothetical protein
MCVPAHRCQILERHQQRSGDFADLSGGPPRCIYSTLFRLDLLRSLQVVMRRWPVVSPFRGASSSEVDSQRCGVGRQKRTVVLYCSGPDETTIAPFEILGIKKGYRHVRALSGGLASWREKGFPLWPIDSSRQ